MSAVVPSLPKGSHEIIKDRLYFASFRKSSQRRANPKLHYFSIDNSLKYQPFFADFGPLNLGLLYRFCCILSDKLADAQQSDKTVVYYCRAIPQNVANAAYLIGSFQIICLNRSIAEAFAPFSKTSFLPFRDASMGQCTYAHTVLHCLEAVDKARRSKFLDFHTFDVEQYEFYERVECGDFNIIVPEKFLAFSGPSSGPVDQDGYPALTPAHYVPIFSQLGVSTIIRLNRRCYDRRKFTAKGFTHYDLIYPDGTNPPARVLDTFLEICKSAKGIVAVHCKAGLGRTGTLIACYMMRHWGWSARECIAWIRICRPGSVIGPQQHYLLHKEAELMSLCRNDRLKRQVIPEAADAAAAATTITTPARGSRKGRMSRNSDGQWVRKAHSLPAAAAAAAAAEKSAGGGPTDLDFGDAPHRPSRYTQAHGVVTSFPPAPPPPPPPSSHSTATASRPTLSGKISREFTFEQCARENTPRNHTRGSSSPHARAARGSTSGGTEKARNSQVRGILATASRVVARGRDSGTNTGTSTSLRLDQRVRRDASERRESTANASQGAPRSAEERRSSRDADLLSKHRYVLDGTLPTTGSAKTESRQSSGLRPDQISQGRYLLNAKRGIREKREKPTPSAPGARSPNSNSNGNKPQRHRSSVSSSLPSTAARPAPVRDVAKHRRDRRLSSEKFGRKSSGSGGLHQALHVQSRAPNANKSSSSKVAPSDNAKGGNPRRDASSSGEVRPATRGQRGTAH